MRPLIESCCESLDEVRASAACGVDRVELCVELTCGGLTPPLGLIQEAVALSLVPVMVLVRPRAGDFAYTDAEHRQTLQAIASARIAGADGVVVGMLTSDGLIDTDQLLEAVEAAAGMPVTFHKAFDALRDVEQGFQACKEAGVARILTSGGQQTALEGAEQLRLLAERGRPVIMAGGSVRAAHVRELIARTGVLEVHARAAAVGQIVRKLR